MKLTSAQSNIQVNNKTIKFQQFIAGLEKSGVSKKVLTEHKQQYEKDQ